MQILSLDTLRFAKQNTTDFSSVVFCRSGCLFGCNNFTGNFARLRPTLFVFDLLISAACLGQLADVIFDGCLVVILGKSPFPVIT